MLHRVVLTAALVCLTASAVEPDQRMRWFEDAKFGLFIHWGPYSSLAGEWRGQAIPVGTEAEWIMQRFNIPVAEYRARAHHFNPTQFDADRWMRLAQSAGMKYVVFTAKHHDGFAMYRSSVTRYNIFDWTDFHRDPVQELSAAARSHGLRFGVYYSHREDWDDPNGFGNTWDYDPAHKNFDLYLEQKSKPQLRELLTRYGPIALVWFDRGMDTNAHAQEFHDLVRRLQPDCLINGRIGSYASDLLGDYQDMNDNGIPDGGLDEYWEAPQTLNTTWGYSQFDQQWKTPADVIHRLVEIVSKGGNYLLNIGPMANGEIPPESVRTLEQVGIWMRANGESIYGTTAGPLAQPWGRTTAKGSTLFLHVFHWQPDGSLPLTGLTNHVLRAAALSEPERPLTLRQVHRTNVVDAATVSRNLYDTVIVVTLDGPPHVAPPVIVQGTESPFLLDGMQAETGGSAAKRFNRLGKLHIAKWTGPQDFVSWRILVSQKGSYRVRIHYSAPAVSEGARYIVTAGSQTVMASIQPTGKDFDYKAFDLGTLSFSQVGSYTVRLAPLKQTNHNLMFFESLELIPAGPLMID